MVREFAEYINPAADLGLPGAVLANVGGHCAGWEFALRTQHQHNFWNPMFINIRYTVVQLSIQAGGNMSLRGYAALDNETIPGKLVIDN